MGVKSIIHSKNIFENNFLFIRSLCNFKVDNRYANENRGQSYLLVF